MTNVFRSLHGRRVAILGAGTNVISVDGTGVNKEQRQKNQQGLSRVTGYLPFVWFPKHYMALVEMLRALGPGCKSVHDMSLGDGSWMMASLHLGLQYTAFALNEQHMLWTSERIGQMIIQWMQNQEMHHWWERVEIADQLARLYGTEALHPVESDCDIDEGSDEGPCDDEED